MTKRLRQAQRRRSRCVSPPALCAPAPRCGRLRQQRARAGAPAAAAPHCPHLSMAAAPARLGPGSAFPPPPAPAPAPEGHGSFRPAPRPPRARPAERGGAAGPVRGCSPRTGRGAGAGPLSHSARGRCGAPRSGQSLRETTRSVSVRRCRGYLAAQERADQTCQGFRTRSAGAAAVPASAMTSLFSPSCKRASVSFPFLPV